VDYNNEGLLAMEVLSSVIRELVTLRHKSKQMNLYMRKPFQLARQKHKQHKGKRSSGIIYVLLIK
jgi:hypothetical protein